MNTCALSGHTTGRRPSPQGLGIQRALALRVPAHRRLRGQPGSDLRRPASRRLSPTTFHRSALTPTEHTMRSLLLLFLGIPIPIIILIALFVN
ncbi:hypothetical protein [Aquabacterium sp.]|uniref:hypothetical protein n=1 Tax=Aquabacterium sp. TaxID=1872578 RepID=UPI002D80F171|nr:hypothetical protein [Aquabacterium sp.]